MQNLMQIFSSAGASQNAFIVAVALYNFCVDFSILYILMSGSGQEAVLELKPFQVISALSGINRDDMVFQYLRLFSLLISNGKFI